MTSSATRLTKEGRLDERGARTLLVAATGGHLEELRRLSPRLWPSASSIEWVTFADPQSDSVLAGERVHLVPYVPPRGYRPATVNLTTAFSVLRRGGFDRVVSTGSGIALPYFLAARALGVSCHYIESAARASGPSLTGRLLARLPGVRLYSQYPEWESRRWHYRGSLFDGYEPVPGVDTSSTPSVRRIVVTLGTMRTFGFRRAVEHLIPVFEEMSPGAEVLWQVGSTDTTGLGIDARDRIPTGELRSAMAEADLVVAHAGIGSALTALDVGRCPVLLPRRRQHREHIDDHQNLIAKRLDLRGLAVAVEADEVTADACWSAARTPVRVRSGTEPFVLD